MGMVLCLRSASLEQLANLRADAAAADNFLFDDAAYKAGELVDFDKAWNALQFMFTGCDAESDHPLSFFPHNAERIGTDNGYGGPWVFTPSQVAAFHSALSMLSDQELKAKYDPATMAANDVYLADHLADEGEEGFEYVMQSVPQLRDLVKRCSELNSAMIGIIT